jgi:hypothetical protein
MLPVPLMYLISANELPILESESEAAVIGSSRTDSVTVESLTVARLDARYGTYGVTLYDSKQFSSTRILCGWI